MGTKIDKIKTHFRENKRTYLVGAGSAILAGGAVYLGMRRDQLVSAKNQNNALVVWKPIQAIDIHIEALGDPGNIVQDLTTGTIYASQGQAARELGVSAGRLSEHIAGKTPDVKGHKFTKLGKAQVS